MRGKSTGQYNKKRKKAGRIVDLDLEVPRGREAHRNVHIQFKKESRFSHSFFYFVFVHFSCRGKESELSSIPTAVCLYGLPGAFLELTCNM